jgi:prepilin-type N-terminal cleavage/methylation domain-containing protein
LDKKGFTPHPIKPRSSERGCRGTSKYLPQRKPRVLTQGAGFTLIEVLIGLVILAFGLLAIAGMQVTSLKGNFFSHYLTQASYASQDRLEFLDNLSYSSNELLAGNHNDGTTTISGVVFNRSYTVVDDPNGYKIINYTVTWNDGVNRSIAFSTIRSQ